MKPYALMRAVPEGSDAVVVPEYDAEDARRQSEIRDSFGGQIRHFPGQLRVGSVGLGDHRCTTGKRGRGVPPPPSTLNASGKLLAANTRTGPSATATAAGPAALAASAESMMTSRLAPPVTTAANSRSCPEVRPTSPTRRGIGSPVSWPAGSARRRHWHPIDRPARTTERHAPPVPIRRTSRTRHAPRRAGLQVSAAVVAGTPAATTAPLRGLMAWRKFIESSGRLRSWSPFGHTVPGAGQMVGVGPLGDRQGIQVGPTVGPERGYPSPGSGVHRVACPSPARLLPGCSGHRSEPVSS